MSCVNLSVAKSVLPQNVDQHAVARETTTVILGPASAAVKDAKRRMMQVAILGPRLTVAYFRSFFVRVLSLFYVLRL